MLMLNTYSSQKKFGFLFAIFTFLFAPILSLLISFIQYREKWAMNMVWLFCAFYSYNFMIGNEGADINRYKARFDYNVLLSENFVQFVQDKLSAGAVDLLEPIISYLVSGITDDFSIYLLIVGTIFGFFYSRNLWFLFNYAPVKFKPVIWVLFILFAIIAPVWDINVVRFTLATHIFIYGFFLLSIKRRKAGWLFFFIAVITHFSFYIPILIYSLHKITGNRIKIYFITFLFSFFISDIVFNNVSRTVAFVPSQVEQKATDYTNEDFLKKRQKANEAKNFRGKYYQLSLKLAVFFLVIVVYFKLKNGFSMYNSDSLYLFNFILLYFTVVNLLQGIPTMNRFLFVGYIIFFAFFIILHCNQPNFKLSFWVWFISIPLFLFYFIMKLRIGLEFTNIVSIVGGPFVSLFMEDSLLLKDLL